MVCGEKQVLSCAMKSGSCARGVAAVVQARHHCAALCPCQVPVRPLPVPPVGHGGPGNRHVKRRFVELRRPTEWGRSEEYAASLPVR